MSVYDQLNTHVYSIETITLEQMIWDVQKWFIVTVVSVIDLHV